MLITPDQVDNNLAWIAALRSGDYQQGKQALISFTQSSFCCLGVACKIKSLEPFSTNGDFLFPNREGRFRAQSGYPDDDWWIEQYGFSAQSTIVSLGQVKSYTLPTLNDHLGLPFTLIADIIEQWLFTENKTVESPLIPEGQVFTFIR